MSTSEITGIVLAGGKATRWGGDDKGLVDIAGRPMVAYVISALAPQVGRIVVSANRNLDAYRAFGWPVAADASGEFLGPLAGLDAGMRAAGENCEWVVTAPCDSPLLGSDIVARLHAAATDSGSNIAVAHDGQRIQPVFALISRELLSDLEQYLDDGGRKTDQWYGRHRMELVDFSDCPDNFLNINAPGDRATVEEKLRLASDT